MVDSIVNRETCTVAVVGAGPSGLALATELKRLRVGKIVVLERESAAGGIPRHCGHYPFGLREYKRLLKGPEYARRNRMEAEKSGVDIRLGATVTALRPGGYLDVATGDGRYVLATGRVVLCTGVRESSRAQRFIGGDRPDGVMSTGALQSLVFLKGLKPFERPVILGSELVSFSAVQTCRRLNIIPAAMVEEQNRIVARRILQPYLRMKRVPLHTGISDPRVIGRERVEALEFSDKRRRRRRIETDGIIVSGRFRPEAALVRSSHLDLDPGTGGPSVDQFGRCSDPTYYCAGNILRPTETAGYCWREGKETAHRIAKDLACGQICERRAAPVIAQDPAIRFVVPQRISYPHETSAVDSFYLGLNQAINATVVITCGDKELWAGKVTSRPVRRIRIPLPDLRKADPASAIRFSVSR